MIVRLERENFHVLGMHGKVIECKPTALQKKRENQNPVALDSEQNQIRRKDIVKVLEGPHAGRDGEIKHLYRSLAFLHSRMYTENGGIFVCKTRHLKLAGGNRNNTNMTNMGLMGFMSPRIQSPMHPGGGNRGRGMRGRGGRGGGMSRDREILGKSIKITGGSYKGAVGIVKDATAATARVELHSSCQTISVDRNHIAVVGATTKDGGATTYGRTPSRTPGYGSQTPTYIGSKTPLHGSATPQYDAGSRTPNIGSMTPSHDGSMTPRAGAWDPTVTNTPARSTDYNYDMDEASPSPGYNPNTPGYSIGNPTFAPHTPGTMYGSDQGYSPYAQQSPSPSSSPYQIGHMETPSPTAYSPNTSGIAPYSPYNPQTPGANLDSQMGDWCTTDIYVKIRTHSDSAMVGQTAIIRTVTNMMCTVFLLAEDRTFSVESHQLEPIPPNVGETFKVILGEDRESTGVVHSVDGTIAVCTINDKTTFKPLKDLCRMQM